MEIDNFIDKHYNLINCTADNKTRKKLRLVLTEYAQSQLKERDELLRQTLDFPHNSMGESLRNDIVKMITSKNK